MRQVNRCDECVYWDNPRPDKINGGLIGDCHFNPPTNMDQYVPGRAVWVRTHDYDWCGQFRKPETAGTGVGMEEMVDRFTTGIMEKEMGMRRPPRYPCPHCLDEGCIACEPGGRG